MGARGPLPSRGRTSNKGTAKRPRRLPDDADAIFRRLVRDIDRLRAEDAALVEDTARWVAIAKIAFADLGLDKTEDERTAEQGLTVADTTHGDGTEKRKNPLLIVLRTASEQIRANAQQLGATPAARARLPEEEPEDDDLATELFRMMQQRKQADAKSN